MYFTVNIFYIIISQVLIDYLNIFLNGYRSENELATIYNKLGWIS